MNTDTKSSLLMHKLFNHYKENFKYTEILKELEAINISEINNKITELESLVKALEESNQSQSNHPGNLKDEINKLKQEIDKVKELINLEKENYKGIAVIKSTITPDHLTKMKKDFHLKLVYNPEFLTEANAFEDFLGY